MNCPCCSGRAYDQCCGRFISHRERPRNAEQLMRSRYSAYALVEIDYLRTSWHPDHRPAGLDIDRHVRWIGLEILGGEQLADRAGVEFEARFLCDGRVDAVHENSDFVKTDDRWYYTRGELLAPRFTPWKPGRNEACPCGSGRKFKRCCAAESRR